MNNSFINKYGQWAVVTGASSGIGQAFAEQLINKGIKVVLVARSEERLRDTADALGKQKTKVVVANLATPEGLSTLEDQTKNVDVGLVVHSAGTVHLGPFVSATKPDIDELIKAHVTATTDIAHLFAHRFKQRSQGGGLVLLSSGFAFTRVPLFAVYAACKSYMLSLGEALSVELRHDNIDVLTVAPGSTRTKMAADIERKVDLSKLPLPMGSPSTVAHVSINALGKKDSVVPGLTNKVMAFSMDRLMGRTLSKKMIGWMLGKAFRSNPT